MAIDVQLESETGECLESLQDPSNLVARLLPRLDDAQSICLRFVDPYGDTVFNNLQMATLIIELENAIENASDERVAAHGKAILRMLNTCRNTVHTYVKFYGD